VSFCSGRVVRDFAEGDDGGPGAKGAKANSTIYQTMLRKEIDGAEGWEGEMRKIIVIFGYGTHLYSWTIDS
jgi:hypothetical protein